MGTKGLDWPQFMVQILDFLTHCAKMYWNNMIYKVPNLSHLGPIWGQSAHVGPESSDSVTTWNVGYVVSWVRRGCVVWCFYTKTKVNLTHEHVYESFRYFVMFVLLVLRWYNIIYNILSSLGHHQADEYTIKNSISHCQNYYD